MNRYFKALPVVSLVYTVALIVAIRSETLWQFVLAMVILWQLNLLALGILLDVLAKFYAISIAVLVKLEIGVEDLQAAREKIEGENE